MEIKIKQLRKSDYERAVRIFTDGFMEEPLHIMAFPDIKVRRHCTRLVYELILFHLIPGLKMQAAGAYADGKLVGVLDYTPPARNVEWTPALDFAVNEMRRKAGTDSIKIIGKYAQKVGAIRPDEPHFYLNDIAVMKSYRGNGIGQKLFRHVERQCFRNSETVCTALDATNTKNVELYQSWGYKIFKTIKFHSLTCYKMKKTLK